MKNKKPKSAIGIFILLFIIEEIIAAVVVGGYAFKSSKKEIKKISSYTKNYSAILSRAFTKSCEIGYKSKNFKELKNLFLQKIETNTIDEAFFVLKNGKIVLHSNPAKTKKLNGNMFNNEFAYNMDLIILQAKNKSKDILFTNYNILSIKTPFDREKIKLIKKYLYKDIDSTGWLVSKAVYQDKETIGTVSFLISKKRIFSLLRNKIKETKRNAKIAFLIALGISFLLSIIISFRYRAMYKRGEMSNSMGDLHRENQPVEKKEIDANMEENILIDIGKNNDETEEEYIAVDLINDEDKLTLGDKDKTNNLTSTEKITNKNRTSIASYSNRKIRDAIPIAGGQNND